MDTSQSDDTGQENGKMPLEITSETSTGVTIENVVASDENLFQEPKSGEVKSKNEDKMIN